VLLQLAFENGIVSIARNLHGPDIGRERYASLGHTFPDPAGIATALRVLHLDNGVRTDDRGFHDILQFKLK
jgi:hypothetical protein